MLEARIAAGGMAEVFRARRVGPASFSRRVCVKRMHEHLTSDRDMVDLFLDEALIGSKLRHRNIVTVDDLGEHAGRYFLAMEYVNGVDLAHVLRRTRALGIQVPTEIVMHVAAETLAGLQAAHSAVDPDARTPLRIVHRDISPQNLLVSYTGNVKIADFGVARAEGRRRVTSVRSVCGKLGYMPPEQAVGSIVDSSSDLFALGVTLFELLTGQRPYVGRMVHPTRDAVLLAMMTDDRPRLRDLRPDTPAALCELVEAVLRAHPAQRIPTAFAAIDVLERAPLLHRGGLGAARWIAELFPGQASVVAAPASPAIRLVPPPRPHTDETDTPRVAQTTSGTTIRRPVARTRRVPVSRRVRDYLGRSARGVAAIGRTWMIRLGRRLGIYVVVALALGAIGVGVGATIARVRQAPRAIHRRTVLRHTSFRSRPVLAPLGKVIPVVTAPKGVRIAEPVANAPPPERIAPPGPAGGHLMVAAPREASDAAPRATGRLVVERSRAQPTVPRQGSILHRGPDRPTEHVLRRTRASSIRLWPTVHRLRGG